MLLSGSAVVGLIGAMAAPGLAQLRSEVVTVEVRPGITMKYLEITGSEAPRAAVILFAGGNGVLRLQPDGTIGSDLALNFLVRSRELFAAESLVTAVLDVPSDLPQGLNGDIRLSQQHAQDIARVIEVLRGRANEVPVWLVGTSSGTLSVVGAGAHLATSVFRPRGIVLTATQAKLVSGLCGRTVYNAPLLAIRGPVLAISHRNDQCRCSAVNNADGAALMAALTGASPKEYKLVSGGNPPASSDPCLARTPHGFFGIEQRVVMNIANWIKTN